jgi:hypothetical protein
MKKSIFLIWIGLFILFHACSRSEKWPVAEFHDLFRVEQSFILADPGLSGMYSDFEMLDDSLLYFIDYGRRSIMTYNIHSGLIKQIGQNGNGPGEYAMPAKLIVIHDSIFFSDFGSEKIQAIDKNGKYLFSKKIPFAETSFTIIHNTIYCSALLVSGFLVLSDDGKKLFRLPEEYRKLRYPISVPGIIDADSLLITKNPYDWNLYIYNIPNGREDVIPIQGFPVRQDWKKFTNQTIAKKKLREEINKMENIFVFDGITINHRFFIAMTVYYPDGKSKAFFIQPTGKVSVEMPQKDLELYDIFQNGTFLFVEKIDDLTLRLYICTPIVKMFV